MTEGNVREKAESFRPGRLAAPHGDRHGRRPLPVARESGLRSTLKACPPRAPSPRRPEPLLTYPRGAARRATASQLAWPSPT